MVLTFINQNYTLMHKFVGTLLAKADRALVSFSGVAVNENVEGCHAADEFHRKMFLLEQQQQKLRFSPFISSRKFRRQVVEQH